MSTHDGGKRLDFACECVSARGGYSDPWAGLSRKRLLPAGTKEEILCSLASAPKTIAQLARELGLSGPSVFSHVTEMAASELLREADGPPKRYPAERYYEPNFPVVKRQESARFEAVCEELSSEMASLFESRLGPLREAFERTTLPQRGWAFEDLTHYLFARAQRGARSALEDRGTLPPRSAHLNGVEWVFWAEECQEED
ncbi:MAG TPA: winged helix-turn-helix domain-containing protein [Pyrinomonadaceae bacterium]|jgi:AcrR family transcriptional regulator|nr:winged helix-turn-helix domain-containing protein [Pyrinomonadaceae bacterium]